MSEGRLTCLPRFLSHLLSYFLHRIYPMIRPSQVWLVFAVCVLGAAGAMAWLTREAVESDRARRAAEASGELEQRVSLALWRMDTELAPIIAEEVIRPPAAFRPTTVALAPPPYVLLQFEARPKGVWESPQSPLKAPILPRLEQLSQAVSLQELLPQLPEMPLPAVKELDRVGLATSDNQQAESPESSSTNTSQFLEANRGANAPPENLQQEAVLQLPNGADQTGPGKALAKNSPAAKEADYQLRNRRYQSAAQQNILNYEQRASLPSDDDPFGNSTGGIDTPERVGVSRPIWVGDRLLIARRVNLLGMNVVQGCWLDWPKLKARLLGEVSDLLPAADLGHIDEDGETDPGRMLAGLPVRLFVNENIATVGVGPTLWWALLIGWGGAFLAAAAAAALLHGVMTLSERRAAFVSSVTHELRTPLTTFRMYAEMLAKGMVPDAARRQEYYETLQRESERLTLLVENVLAYARLERGRNPQGQDRVTVAGVLERIGPRLKARAAQAGMECLIEVEGESISGADGSQSEASRAVLRPDRGRGRPGSPGFDEEFTTDIAVVEQILFNLVDNAAKYARSAADRRIHVEATRNGQYVKFIVRDHGPGIGGKGSERGQPFEKSAQESAETAPGVGLGLALCRRLARQLGGRLEVSAANGEGTLVTLLLPAS